MSSFMVKAVLWMKGRDIFTFFLAVLGMEPAASCTLGRCCAAELYPQPLGAISMGKSFIFPRLLVFPEDRNPGKREAW